MTELPSIVCFKSANNNKYLRFKSNTDVNTHGLLEFAGENMKDPYAQFEVEKAKNWPGLVHIKSRYNNKYLVRWSPNRHWISATGDAPDEDQTKWSCTLFRAFVASESDKTIRLVHTQLGNYVRLVSRNSSDPFNLCLFAESNQVDNNNKLDVLTFVDWTSFFTLPKRVAIRADGKEYLGAVINGGKPVLQFSFKDVKDPKAAHQIISSPDGTVYIKSEYYGKFWRVGSDEWVVVDAVDPLGKKNEDTMFRLIPIDVNVFSLINMKSTTFIKRLTAGTRESYLAAKVTSTDVTARLTLVDLDK